MKRKIKLILIIIIIGIVPTFAQSEAQGLKDVYKIFLNR
jgi:hypothetical protein